MDNYPKNYPCYPFLSGALVYPFIWKAYSLAVVLVLQTGSGSEEASESILQVVAGQLEC